jgi:hypothetical protein
MLNIRFRIPGIARPIKEGDRPPMAWVRLSSLTFETVSNQRERSAHTCAPNEKKPLGHISLFLLDFRWAPD